MHDLVNPVESDILSAEFKQPSIYMNAYPSIKQSFGIFGIFLAVSIVCAIPYVFLTPYIDDSTLFLLIYLGSMGGTFFITNSLRKKQNRLSEFNFRIPDQTLLPFVGVVTIALLFGLIGPISSLIPLDDFTKKIFLDMSQRDGLSSFLAIVIAAPILEELIFRGIILDGFLKRYSPMKAIILSGVMFGIVHLNPRQFVTAFIAGCFMGWIYYRTKSLSLTIFIHAVNNFTAYVLMQIQPITSENIDESVLDAYGGVTILISTVGICFVIIGYGIYLLNQKMGTILWSDPVDKTLVLEETPPGSENDLITINASDPPA